MHFLEEKWQEIYPDEYAGWFVGTNKRRHCGNGNTVNLDSPSKAAFRIKWCTNTLCWLEATAQKISSLVLETTKHGVFDL